MAKTKKCGGRPVVCTLAIWTEGEGGPSDLLADLPIVIREADFDALLAELRCLAARYAKRYVESIARDRDPDEAAGPERLRAAELLCESQKEELRNFRNRTISVEGDRDLLMVEVQIPEVKPGHFMDTGEVTNPWWRSLVGKPGLIEKVIEQFDALCDDIEAEGDAGIEDPQDEAEQDSEGDSADDAQDETALGPAADGTADETAQPAETCEAAVAL